MAKWHKLTNKIKIGNKWITATNKPWLGHNNSNQDKNQ